MARCTFVCAFTLLTLPHASGSIGSKLDRGIKVMTPFVEEKESPKEGVKIFEPLPDLKVVVANSNNWVPKVGCNHWIYRGTAEINEREEENPYNGVACTYDMGEHIELKTAETMFDDFLDEFGDILKTSFGVTNCHFKPNQAFTKITPKNFTKVGSKLTWHPDGCRSTKERHITVVSNQHEVWKPEWGGQTEFATQRCTELGKDSVFTGSSMPAVAVLPMPRTTVIFDGPLVHRQTSPSASAGNPIRTREASTRWGKTEKGDRIVVVMQMICRR